MDYIEVQGKRINVDKEGYLLDRHDWTPDVCRHMAKKDYCELTDEHWKVINFLRTYYEDFNHSPAMRVFIKALKEVSEKDKIEISSQKLYALFPYGPAKQATRYAGLPKPAHCI